MKRRLAPALIPFVLTSVLTATAAAASWRLEPINASEGVAGLLGLSFDAQGRGLLSWSGSLRGHAPPVFGGLASRDPVGGWLRPPDLTGVEPQTAQIHLYADSRALLVAREAASDTSKRSLVVAEGQSDGGFGPLGVLDDFSVDSWSAANDLGQALIAWTNERSPFIRVSERLPGQPPSPPRDLAIATSAAVAMNQRGDRVLAFPDSAHRLGARVRSAGGEWGPIVSFGNLPSTKGVALSAVVARNGRAVVTWGAPGRPCGVSVRAGDGTWRTRRLERHCGPAAVGPRAAPVVPIADTSGATYVAWTGRTRSGRRAVKFARVGPGASQRALVLSHQRGAVLDDGAAGPGRALALTWTAAQPLNGKSFTVATFAAVRRAGGGFDTERVTPSKVVTARGSRVAFQPLTGEPVVAVPFLLGRTVAVGAAIGSPAALSRPAG